MSKEEKKDEIKNKISMALKDPILQQCFEIICKNLTVLEQQIADIKSNCDLAIEGRDIKIKELEEENERLKAELKEWKDEWQEQVQKAIDEGYARTQQTIQLTNATEIIKNCVCIINRLSPTTALLDKNERSLLEQAEQFIKEE